MIPKFLTRNLTTVSLTVLFLADSIAQNASVFWIDVSTKDTCGSSWVIHKIFGNHIYGTYSTDYQLSEFECPPVPPAPFDALWINIPGRYSQTFGFQRCGPDLREWSTPSRVDTFQLSFYNWCDSIGMFSFHWPDSSYLADRCDSMFIVDASGRIPKTNMLIQDSLNIPDGESYINNHFLIIKYGARLADVYVIITGVQQERDDKAHGFALHENFPNPFNPSTTLSFDIGHSSFVTLKIFNVFGQDVATLVNNRMEQGSYSVEWNAGTYPSGVYFYELHSENRTTMKKMMLLR